MKRRLDDLSMIDNFLMNEVATDIEIGPDACREMISTLLQRKVGKVRVVTQRNIPPGLPERRGIILDIEVEEDVENKEGLPDLNIYDLEPHRKPKKREDLPKRVRFYQSKIDGRRLGSGERNFGKLPDLYIVFILDYDPFGYDQVCYTIDNTCAEVPELDYKDGLKIMYFNATGKLGGNESIKNMLNFIVESKPKNVVDDATGKMYDYIKHVKRQEATIMRFMSIEEYVEEYYADDLEEAREEALKRGREEGERLGREEGERLGRKQGDINRIIIIICRKLSKGKKLEEIADDLEEEVDNIRTMYDIASSFEPEYEADKVYEAYVQYVNESINV